MIEEGGKTKRQEKNTFNMYDKKKSSTAYTPNYQDKIQKKGKK